VTYNEAQPARSNGAGTDVKTFATAVLLTFGAGLLAMVGNGLLDSFFGAILGLVAAGFGIVFWKNKLDGKVFPAVIPTKGLVILAVVNVALLLGLLLILG
jgi:hypothetical protein